MEKVGKWEIEKLKKKENSNRRSLVHIFVKVEAPILTKVAMNSILMYQWNAF